MNEIRTKAQQQSLQDMGKDIAAKIAGEQGAFRAATAGAAQKFKEGLRGRHGGPESPAKVFADFIEESFARRGQYNADVSPHRGPRRGRDRGRRVQRQLRFPEWEAGELAAETSIGRRADGTGEPQRQLDSHVRAHGRAPREARFLTGAGSVENKDLKASLDVQKKQLAVLMKMDAKLADSPVLTAVFT